MNNSFFVEESVVFTCPYQANKNHAAELSTVSHVISERHRKSTFDFTEIVNNYGLKREKECQIVRFMFQFSLVLYIQFWKYFHSVVLRSVGRDYFKKIGYYFWPNFFWLGCLSAFKFFFFLTATILFLQFVQSSSFVGIRKYEIPGAAMMLRQLKVEQFSPAILNLTQNMKIILWF